MTELQALALSYGFTVVAAFVLMCRGAFRGIEMGIELVRAGAISTVPTALADDASYLRALRITVVCLCAVLSTTWFTCAFAWLVLRRVVTTMGEQVDKAHEQSECPCDKCQVAKFFTGDTPKPDNKLDALRLQFKDRCPNCGVNLNLPSLCFHQPLERGVCISQWDDLAESQELLGLMLNGGAGTDSGVVDALDWRVAENREL
jgi:hypothetical protein